MRALLIIGLIAVQAGCELFEPPAPKGSKGSVKSAEGAKEGISNLKVLAGNPEFIKQSLGGVTFEAPFEVKASEELMAGIPADLRSQLKGVECYAGSAKSPNSQHLVQFQIVVFRGAGNLAANMEPAMRQAIRAQAARIGDPNPSPQFESVNFGAVSGFKSRYSFEASQDNYYCQDAINVSQGDSMWQIFASTHDPTMSSFTGRIIRTVSIQP